MAMGKLSEKAVQAAKPTAADRKISDGDGLFLLVKTNGTRLWRMKYRFAGKEKLLSFGAYPEVGLKDARQCCFEARKLLGQSIDPSAEKKAAKARLIESAQPVATFEVVMDELIEAKAKRSTEKHIQDYRRSMELHVLPKLGNKGIQEITAIEVIELGKSTEARGKYLAHRIIQRIGEVFDYAVATGRRDQNPVTKMTHATISPHARENNPAISERELPLFLHDLEVYRGFYITKLSLRFLLLTACRTGEMRDLIWEWVDLENKLITIPATGYKTGRKSINQGKAGKPHFVPLSSQVVALLREAQSLTGNSGAQYIFPTHRNFDTKASENVISSAIANMGVDGRWKGKQSGHGFRRLARTSWGESGKWSYEAMERQLAHSVGNATVSAYDKAERLEERKEMLQWWANRIDELAKGAKVLELKRVAG
jgi:integrase